MALSNSNFEPSSQVSSSTNRSTSDPLSCQAAFEQALQQIGEISPQAFAQQYKSNADYLSQISWDPTTAQFWEEFNRPPMRTRDFRLNPTELDHLKRNGFVVSERLGANTFTNLLHQLYSSDLPVFISTDAILHAWHRSFDAVLEEIETAYLAISLGEILQGMAEAIPGLMAAYGDDILGLSILDADYFIAVARSLLIGTSVATAFNQTERVAATLKAVEDLALQDFLLFGRDRTMDFSQFKVRGHYEHSPQLQQYFRAMMWCGTVDLRIAGDPGEASLRELGGAIVLYTALKQAQKFEQWHQLDDVIQTFVGKTDSMTFAQLGELLEAAEIHSLDDVQTWDNLTQLQNLICLSEAGTQAITGHPYAVAPNTIKKQLPRSFTVMGQKFVLDSWVTSQVVCALQRRIPSALDVAFTVLGNDQTVPMLVKRITNKQGRPFRDGFPYQDQLAALRQVIDSQDDSVWSENIYMAWLSTLRALSIPTTGDEYPEAMRTQAWAMKTLNTQLASWTQLRHDTILYVKQSSTMYLTCFYPAGFVEPRLEFWQRFETMARRAAELLEKTIFPDSYIEYGESSNALENWYEWVKRYKANVINEAGERKARLHVRKIQQRQVTFFQDFAEKLAILKELSRKELAQEPFSDADISFIRKMVEVINHGSGAPTYSGWYFSLFYQGHQDSKTWDALVADVHTDFPDLEGSGDPGCVLYQGVGNVDLLVIAVDNGQDRMVYAGPVLSHYEFEILGTFRKSDSEWQDDLRQKKVPPRPEWCNDYLVPEPTSISPYLAE